MAFTDIKAKLIEKRVGSFVDQRRPPPHLRAKLDLAFRIKGQRVEIFKVRPRWQGAPGETMEHPVAKATYVRTRELWRIFWMRADLKWHGYPPVPQVGSIAKVLALVAEDKHGCFFA